MLSEALAVLLYRPYLLYWYEMLWVDLNRSPGTASDVNPVKCETDLVYKYLQSSFQSSVSHGDIQKASL